MAKKRIGEIIISKRVVRIGHEVYPLANISRVQTVRLVPGGKDATLYPLHQIIILLALLAGVVGAALVVLPELGVDVGFGLEEAARQFAVIATVVAGIRLAYLLFALFYRLLLRPKRYALILETAGTQYTALSGTDAGEIHRIKDKIVAAIEDPPATEERIQINGDFVVGDKVSGGVQNKLTGGNNMMFNR
jgi:hypothetical protein